MKHKKNSRCKFTGYILVWICVLFQLKGKSQIINTVAGNGVFGYAGDNGQATAAEISYPRGLATDSSGNVYVADESNNRIRVLDATTGNISTIAGNGSAGFSGDGGNATLAKLFYASAIAIDSAGDIYIADNDNNRIRKVTKSSGLITTIAGNGSPGFWGDGGNALLAEVNQPSGLAIDDSNNLFISDTYNKRIRKINAKTGIITTVAGNGTAGFSGDGGPATAASVRFAIGIAVDTIGNLYIADTQNSRIRKVNLKTGIITTIAGDSIAGFSGDGGQASSAELNYPIGVATDRTGNIFIADTHNNRIREISEPNGIITTIAGDGNQGFAGDGGLAIAAELNFPSAVVINRYNNLYISDEDNYRIRKLSLPLGIMEPANISEMSIYPNPSKGCMYILPRRRLCTTVKVDDILGREIFSKPISREESKIELDLGDVPNGIYVVAITTTDGVITKRILVKK